MWWGFLGLYAESSPDADPPAPAPPPAPRNSRGVTFCMTHRLPVLNVLRAKLLLCSGRASLSPRPICSSGHQRKEYWVNIHEKPYMSSELNAPELGLPQTS